ncbi:MAG TPA: hypothetical protein VH740_13080 [Vicinamibacterales bacterium]
MDFPTPLAAYPPVGDGGLLHALAARIEIDRSVQRDRGRHLRPALFLGGFMFFLGFARATPRIKAGSS